MKKSDVHRIAWSEIPTGLGGILLKPELTPFTVYRILKDWFGPSYDGDDKVQWQFPLRVPNAYIIVRDYKIVSVSVELYPDDGDHEKAGAIGAEFIELLDKQKERVLKKIKEARLTAKSHMIFNPYSNYLYDAEQLLNRAKTLKETKQERPESPDADEDIIHKVVDELNEMLARENEVNALVRASFFLFMAAFEGLLNLIYELYLKPELRDKRVYDRLAREEIDLKVILAPTYCVCFGDEKLAFRADEFDRFQFIVGLRNNFVHANLTLHSKTAIVSEDRHLFVIGPDYVGKYQLSQHISGLTIQNIEFVQSTVNDMVQTILHTMSPEYRETFEYVMHRDSIQVHDRQGRMIVVIQD